MLVRVAYTIVVDLPVSEDDVEKVVNDDFATIEKLRTQAKDLADKYLLDGCPALVIRCESLPALEE